MNEKDIWKNKKTNFTFDSGIYSVERGQVMSNPKYDPIGMLYADGIYAF